jgi:hypothetical protein
MVKLRIFRSLPEGELEKLRSVVTQYLATYEYCYVPVCRAI